MAKEDDGTIAIQVDDLDTVPVDVSADPALAQQAVVDSDPKPAKETKTKTKVRVSPDPESQVAVTGPTPEQALEEARNFAKQQEDARKAAEATAASERARAEAAERDRQAALKQAEEFQQRAASSELTLIDSSIASTQRELDSQRDAYTRAAEAGEFAKMADIQIKMSKAAAALDRFEAEKASIEANAARSAQTVTEGRVDYQPQVSSQTERFLSQFAPTAQNWLRQHMDCLPAEYGGDQTKNAKMMAGHYAALAQSIQANTPRYFEIIEEHLGVRQQSAPTPATTGATTAPAAPTSAAAQVHPAQTQRHQAVPAAPVSRDPGQGTQPRNVREVRLTKEQQEMAKVSFPHLTDQQAFGMYARNLIELEAEGKLGRTSH